MDAGKDVYVEKPMVHKVGQGLGMVEAQRKTGRICQVGSQRVSSILYAKAKELLASGGIGPLNLVEAWWNRNSPHGRVAVHAAARRLAGDRGLGALPRPRAAAGRSIPSASSAGATTTTTGPAWPATSSSTSSPACTW